jgi:hypothetical protein
MKKMKKVCMFSATMACCVGAVFAGNAPLNLALNKPATANSSTSAEIPSRATDGNRTTNWCTPGYTGWIQVDLQNHFSVDSLKLYVNQYVAGNSTHEVKVSTDMTHWTLVKTLSGYTSNNQLLTVAFDTPLTGIRGVMVNTTASTSWVAWYEIEAYGTLSTPSVTKEGNVLTSSSTVNNQWYLNGNPIPNATSSTYTVTVPGSYQVRVSEGNQGGVLSDALNVTEILTGIDAVKAKDIRVYPNPANDWITIEGKTVVQLELLNLQGESLQRVKAVGTQTRMNVSTLPAGVYSLKITTPEGTVVQKVLKQ